MLLENSAEWKLAQKNMSSETEALIRICESLPEAKRHEVADFVRFLAARQDDERWESLLAYPQSRPKTPFSASPPQKAKRRLIRPACEISHEAQLLACLHCT